MQPGAPSPATPRATVAFAALGSRGDVQPLALLAYHLQAAFGADVRFITHSCHAAWLAELLPDLRLGPGLPHAPGRVWQQAAGGGAASAAPPPPRLPEPEEREAVVRAICDALGLPVPPRRAAGARPEGPQEQEQEQPGAPPETAAGAAAAPAATQPSAAAEPRRSLIVFNLFCLEAYHVAEALAVPCTAAQPYLIPYTCPAAFERRFASAHPALHAALREACGNEEGRVSWAEVRHWMWPLFTDRWGAWRSERLRLDPVPLAAGTPGGGRESGDVDGGAALPPATPLLYGFSELVVPRPGHWPPSVHACGFWLQAHVRRAHPREEPSGGTPGGAPAAASAAAARAMAARPVLVDFGSMGLLGLLPPPEALLRLLVRALELAGRRGLLLSAGWPPLAAAHAALPPAARARLRRHATPLAAHDLLLARCAVALHHGGSGTTAAALAAGTPQLLVPLQFDQPFWAERVAHLGLSPAPLDAAAIGGGQGGGSLKGGGSGGGSSAGGAGATDDACDAAAALVAGRLMQAVGCEDIRRRCADMAAALQAPEECGIDVAAAAIIELLGRGRGD